MEFQKTALEGLCIIRQQRLKDERGFFARSYCDAEFAEQGLTTNWPQSNVSYNHQRGTLRGLHWQAAPHGEAKIVQCMRGSIYDVVVDIRNESPTFGKYFAIELEADNATALYIPEGFAHGFLTLTDETLVDYRMSAAYVAESAQGLLWNDAAIGIDWPFYPKVVSEKDQQLPLLAKIENRHKV